jgi:hypothetical protein
MYHWRRLLPLLLPPLLLVPLGACTPDYPMDRPGTWNIPPGTLGSNDANLRAMVVDPRDLTEGASADGSEGYEAAPPVRKLIAGRRPALPNMNASTIDASSGQATSPGTAGTNGSVQAQ